jgi:hypothetical protein
VGGADFRILADGSAVDGRWGLVECTLAPGWGGPPQHIHREHDESFFILTGTVKFTSGRDELLATPDTLVTAAIGDPHTFGTVPAGQRSAQHRKDRTVGGSELGSLDVAAQPTELVAENRDLDIFGVLASEAAEHHADESAGHEVEEGQGRRRIIP